MSQRTNQVDALLVKEVSEIVARDIEPPMGSLITVMRAEVTPDLKHATIFVSVLPENKTGSALTVLKKRRSEIQRQLNKKLFMKFVPHIKWDIDPTNVKYAAIDKALKQ